MCIPSAEALAENPSLGKISVLIGTEPARRWKSFAAEVVEMVEDREIEAVLFLGAMLADVPHTRPITITATSQNELARQELDIERSQYEGPVGILSVLGIEFEKLDIPAVALWASVPHYVHNTPSPKATLSLLIEIEKLLGVQFDHGKLGEDAFAWERGIDEIAEADDEMTSYIKQLEKTRDEVESSAATGDALAKEFEKFLRAESKDESEGEAPA
jgi:predicted ATP-grasp superfamily ATP-dependent carboligase